MQKHNYHLEMQQAMRQIPAGTRLLLHACCGPCAAPALQQLCSHFAVDVLYYNPGIAPQQEYYRRRAALQTVVEHTEAAFPLRLLDEEYRPEAFEVVAAGLENEPEGGARCSACFAQRLDAAAGHAAQNGIPWVATTLTTGPRKNAAVINQIGQAAAQKHGVGWLAADFKKQGGYQRSIELSRQFGIYRQQYCGCRFSRGPGTAPPPAMP